MIRELESLRDQSRYRTLENPAGIDLSSNDYLGLASDPRLKQAVIRAVERSAAVGSTGSRLLSGNSPEWGELECTFADFAGTESALYFGSGYAANLGLLSSLLGPGDVVFSDALNHASLIDGIRLSRATKVIYPHRDVEFLERALRQYADCAGSKLIVTETLFSMEGDIAPLAKMIELARTHGAEIVIDEAHATGVRGPAGRGIAVELGVERDVLAIVHTCGKALASAGAFACGSEVLKNYLINRARTFIFSTAMPPYLAAQIRAAVELAHGAEHERSHLRAISSALREGLCAEGIDCGTSEAHIVPVILSKNEIAVDVAGELRRAGFAARAIRPPTVPEGKARVRISLTSKITMNDIERLISATVASVRSLSRERSSISMHA